ncbi:MAG: tryptophan-rich sensory protein [Bradymonadales bacterium]|nr:tryptophan-rich sensory protein [Bradymonadales bacterium]
MKNTGTWLLLGGFLLVTFGVAAIGGAVTGPAVRDWYPSVIKPSWTPPGWLFGPVWTLLYAMMAVAVWLVWRKLGWQGAKVALILFAVQLLLNSAWSILFFGLHRIDLALIDIGLLLAAIVATTVVFWKATPIAGILFLPYLAWVSFASALNFALWRLNG